MTRGRAAHSVALTDAAKAWIKSQPWYARQDDVDLDGPLLKQPLYLLLERHASHLLPRRDGEARHKSCAQCAGLLCWLAHGRLLSDQADDARDQPHLRARRAARQRVRRLAAVEEQLLTCRVCGAFGLGDL